MKRKVRKVPKPRTRVYMDTGRKVMADRRTRRRRTRAAQEAAARKDQE